MGGVSRLVLDRAAARRSFRGPIQHKLDTASPDQATNPATDPAGGWVCAPRLRSLLARMHTDPIVQPDLTTGAYRPCGRLIRLLAARVPGRGAGRTGAKATSVV